MFEYECPVCNKEITSQYENQFIANIRGHLLTHYEALNSDLGKEMNRAQMIITEKKTEEHIENEEV